MKNKLKTSIISAAAALTAFVILVTVIHFSQKKKITEYRLNVAAENEYLKGTLELTYVNDNAFDIDKLCFCLYPNAFKEESNINNVAAAELVEKAYPKGFDSGWINIESVNINGKKADFVLEENAQILRLDTKVKKGKTQKIEIVFSEKLPYSPMRYGYGDNTYNYCNWYPVLCPFENGEPVKLTYISNGDPFYSQTANYSVTLSAPQNMRLAASGTIDKEKSDDPLKNVWKIKGENIRDFAFVLSDKFELLSSSVGGTIVYSYYLGDDSAGGKNALDYACNALKSFNSKFGEYPYETYSVVASDFYIGGMEYPQLVLINKDFYTDSKQDALEETVVHETAHQWWYSMVGNNEVASPWLDEGLTQYSTALYFEECYGKEAYRTYLSSSETYCRIIFDMLKNAGKNVDKKIERAGNEFENWMIYDAITYDVSALMLDSLRKTVGDEAFFSGMRRYFENNKYKIATKQSFIRDFSEGCGREIGSVIEPWLAGKVYWG